MRNAKLITIHGAKHGFVDVKGHADLAIKTTIDFFLEKL